jgi:hypothetical protein
MMSSLYSLLSSYEFQHLSDIPNITFHQGLPSPEVVDEFTADRHHRLIVLDDVMHRVVQNVNMELLFTQDVTIAD